MTQPHGCGTRSYDSNFDLMGTSVERLQLSTEVTVGNGYEAPSS
ncbi:hypothetical protein [Rothia endophytica]